MTEHEVCRSWYEASRNWHHRFPCLTEDLRVDVCVLGGGLTGLSTALELSEAGYRVALLEARRVGWGASGRSGGQLIIGLACDPTVIERQLGFDGARAVIEISAQGLGLVRQRIARHGIDCQLRDGHTHCALNSRQMRALEAWQTRLAGYGYDQMHRLDRAGLQAHIDSGAYLGGVHDARGGHVHPLNYTLGLARAAHACGAHIYEESPVLHIDSGQEVTMRCARGQVRCRYAVLAGNAYLSGLMPAIESKIMPVATYITATERLGPERARSLMPLLGAFADVNFVLNYFRLSGDFRLLFGGLASYSLTEPHNLERALRERMLRVFPQLRGVRQEYTWGGNVAITVNRAPHFGRIGHNICFAHGYSGHGMAMTTMAGHLLARAIAGQAEHLDPFSRIRHRRFFGGRWVLALGMACYRFLDLF